MEEMTVCGKFLIPDLTQQNWIEDGALYVRGDRIVDVAKRTDLLARYPNSKCIGGDDYLIIPGLIDSHQHGRGLSHMQRAGVLDENLEIWLHKLRGLGPIPTYFMTAFAAMKLIEAGVTCTLHSENCLVPGRCEQEATEGIRAYKDVGIRVAFALGIRDRNNYVYQNDQVFLLSLPTDLRNEVSAVLPQGQVMSMAEYFDLFDKLRVAYEDSRTKMLLGPYGEVWCSDEIFAGVREKAKETGCGVHLHLLETKYQREYFLGNFGKTPVRHLWDIGLLTKNTSCAHSAWVTREDVDIFRDTGAIVVHNPSSNLRLRSGIAPVGAMVESGVKVSLGMDGMSLNDDNDIFQEIRLCGNLHNQPGIGKSRMSPGQVFRMATLAGAEATTFTDEIGVLEIGKKADIVLMRHEAITYPYLSQDISLRDALFYRGKGMFVDTVIVDGSVVMENRKFTRICRESVADELRSAASIKPSAEVLRRRELLARMTNYVEDFYRKTTFMVSKPFYNFNSRNE